MSEYAYSFDSIREDITAAIEAVGRIEQAEAGLGDNVRREIERNWKDHAALRDELHALANRVEIAIRGLTTEPAEVAEKIVSLLPTYPEVRCDKCRRTYVVNESAGQIIGNCPSCGFGKLSTTLEGPAGVAEVTRWTLERDA